MKLAYLTATLVLGLGGACDSEDDTASCGDNVCSAAESCGSCPADCGTCTATCGNGFCDGSETCSTCAADCGSCSCTRGDGTCTGETVCINGSCAPAFGRMWQVTVYDGSVPTTKPTGEDWDFGGGAPDLFAQVEVDGSIVGSTITAQDSFSAVWNESFDITLVGGSSLAFWMWDEDISDNDYAYGCAADPVPVSLLRSGEFFCDSSEGSLTGYIDPK